MKGWYESSGSKSKGVYMPASDFRKLTQDGIELIRGRLGQHEYADRIVRRLGGCFTFGVAEKFDNFFAELGLPVSKAEKDAIQSRNRVVHGGGLDESMWDDYVEKRKTYQTLLNRVILKLLGYEGLYIDYGTVGFPQRALSEPSGGTP